MPDTGEPDATGGWRASNCGLQQGSEPVWQLEVSVLHQAIILASRNVCP